MALVSCPRVNPAVRRDRPNAREIEKLELNEGEMVVRFCRIRFFNEIPTIFETITLPLEHLWFGTEVEPPNNLFWFYQSQYGVTVAKAAEDVRAIAANTEVPAS